MPERTMPFAKPAEAWANTNLPTAGTNRATNAGATPTAATLHKLDPNSAVAGSTAASAFATPPTLTATDMFRMSFNSQSGVDLLWKLFEELVVAAGTANGLAFINRDNALPASRSLVISVEIEE